MTFKLHNVLLQYNYFQLLLICECDLNYTMYYYNKASGKNFIDREEI